MPYPLYVLSPGHCFKEQLGELRHISEEWSPRPADRLKRATGSSAGLKRAWRRGAGLELEQGRQDLTWNMARVWKGVGWGKEITQAPENMIS